MANTYHQVYIQCVFAVKYREAIINKDWRPTLLGVIGNLIVGIRESLVHLEDLEATLTDGFLVNMKPMRKALVWATKTRIPMMI